MDITTARANLVRLLCINLENYDLDQLRKLVKKRYLAWHPDKNTANPDKYRGLFEDLKNSWEVYYRFFGLGIPADRDSDLFCYESESSENESEYESTPFDEDFFNTSPKKEFTTPENYKIFFRANSNRRAGKFFAIFFKTDDPKKVEDLYKKKPTEYFGHWKIEDNIQLILIFYVCEQRLLEIKKLLRECGIFKNYAYYGINFKSFLMHVIDNHGEPIYEPSTAKRTGKTNNLPKDVKFDHKLFCDFALSRNITETFLLMSEYAHFAHQCTRTNESKEHEDDHKEHELNAKFYIHMCDRFKIAKNGVQCVLAELYSSLIHKTNTEFLNLICEQMGDDLLNVEDCEMFGHADFFARHVMKDKFKIYSKTILASFMFGEPKRRYVGLQGPYGCGKTSFAYAFLHLFDGISININVSEQRLPFYLGSAIGRRFILFDDVKGQQTDDLSYGIGFKNLDNMRDYLDGHVPVQLEKKNQNPVNQIFPAGILTCNEYPIPSALRERILFFQFKTNSKLFEKHSIKVNRELLFVALVLLDLLPVKDYVRDHFISRKNQWYARHSTTCNCLQVRYHSWVRFCRQWAAR